MDTRPQVQQRGQRVADEADRRTERLTMMISPRAAAAMRAAAGTVPLSTWAYGVLLGAMADNSDQSGPKPLFNGAMEPNDQAERLLDATDLASRFGVTVSTVHTWVRRGRIPCVRPSRRIVRFRLADVEAALTPTIQPGASSYFSGGGSVEPSGAGHI